MVMMRVAYITDYFVLRLLARSVMLRVIIPWTTRILACLRNHQSTALRHTHPYIAEIDFNLPIETFQVTLCYVCMLTVDSQALQKLVHNEQTETQNEEGLGLGLHCTCSNS